MVLDKSKLAALASQLGTAVGIGGPILLSLSRPPAEESPFLRTHVCELKDGELGIVKAALTAAFGNATCHYENVTIGAILGM